jgi:hypothetical protein
MPLDETEYVPPDVGWGETPPGETVSNSGRRAAAGRVCRGTLQTVACNSLWRRATADLTSLSTLLCRILRQSVVARTTIDCRNQQAVCSGTPVGDDAFITT